MDGSNDRGRTTGHAGRESDGAAGASHTPNPGTPDPGTPDLSSLARDWIELWQSEFAALAADPETAETWSRLAALWAGAAASGIAAMPRGARDERNAPFPGAWPLSWPASWPPAAPWPAPAAAAPDAGGPAPRRDPARHAGSDAGGDDARVLQRVLDRLDAIEQRLATMERAALEQRDGGGTGTADPRAPRRRNG